MTRIRLAILGLVLTSHLLSGCSETTRGDTHYSTPPRPLAGDNHLKKKAVVASSTAVPALEEAHRSYLKAYENYVKMLRESGPQTMETLNALADYQKRYQIYQMLLGAEKDLPTLATGSPTAP